MTETTWLLIENAIVVTYQLILQRYSILKIGELDHYVFSGSFMECAPGEIAVESCLIRSDCKS